MNTISNYLLLEDKPLREQCEEHVYKSSGPGGQHRNKVSSAVRLVHSPTGVTAHGDESRSQHQNRRSALRRLRMNIACSIRNDLDITAGESIVPELVRHCIHKPKGKTVPDGQMRLSIGKRDARFWAVAAFVLDLLSACQGRLRDAATIMNITIGNLSNFIKLHRHLLTAAQRIRKENALGSIH